ncbi:hypothetical protein NEOKW01_1573 [Nematocida sp. AWRm80]|nr:hypothetical protein NEOKW01_1573 [Nematocida sp. AWRm80]
MNLEILNGYISELEQENTNSYDMLRMLNNIETEYSEDIRIPKKKQIIPKKKDQTRNTANNSLDNSSRRPNQLAYEDIFQEITPNKVYKIKAADSKNMRLNRMLYKIKQAKQIELSNDISRQPKDSSLNKLIVNVTLPEDNIVNTLLDKNQTKEQIEEILKEDRSTEQVQNELSLIKALNYLRAIGLITPKEQKPERDIESNTEPKPSTSQQTSTLDTKKSSSKENIDQLASDNQKKNKKPKKGKLNKLVGIFKPAKREAQKKKSTKKKEIPKETKEYKQYDIIPLPNVLEAIKNKHSNIQQEQLKLQLYLEQKRNTQTENSQVPRYQTNKPQIPLPPTVRTQKQTATPLSGLIEKQVNELEDLKVELAETIDQLMLICQIIDQHGNHPQYEEFKSKLLTRKPLENNEILVVNDNANYHLLRYTNPQVKWRKNVKSQLLNTAQEIIQSISIPNSPIITENNRHSIPGPSNQVIFNQEVSNTQTNILEQQTNLMNDSYRSSTRPLSYLKIENNKAIYRTASTTEKIRKEIDEASFRNSPLALPQMIMSLLKVLPSTTELSNQDQYTGNISYNTNLQGEQETNIEITKAEVHHQEESNSSTYDNTINQLTNTEILKMLFDPAPNENNTLSKDTSEINIPTTIGILSNTASTERGNKDNNHILLSNSIDNISETGSIAEIDKTTNRKEESNLLHQKDIEKINSIIEELRKYIIDSLASIGSTQTNSRELLKKIKRDKITISERYTALNQNYLDYLVSKKSVPTVNDVQTSMLEEQHQQTKELLQNITATDTTFDIANATMDTEILKEILELINRLDSKNPLAIETVNKLLTLSNNIDATTALGQDIASIIKEFNTEFKSYYRMKKEAINLMINIGKENEANLLATAKSSSEFLFSEEQQFKECQDHLNRLSKEYHQSNIDESEIEDLDLENKSEQETETEEDSKQICCLQNHPLQENTIQTIQRLIDSDKIRYLLSNIQCKLKNKTDFTPSKDNIKDKLINTTKLISEINPDASCECVLHQNLNQVHSLIDALDTHSAKDRDTYIIHHIARIEEKITLIHKILKYAKAETSIKTYNQTKDTPLTDKYNTIGTLIDIGSEDNMPSTSGTSKTPEIPETRETNTILQTDTSDTTALVLYRPPETDTLEEEEYDSDVDLPEITYPESNTPEPSTSQSTILDSITGKSYKPEVIVDLSLKEREAMSNAAQLELELSQLETLEPERPETSQLNLQRPESTVSIDEIELKEDTTHSISPLQERIQAVLNRLQSKRRDTNMYPVENIQEIGDNDIYLEDIIELAINRLNTETASMSYEDQISSIQSLFRSINLTEMLHTLSLAIDTPTTSNDSDTKHTIELQIPLEEELQHHRENNQANNYLLVKFKGKINSHYLHTYLRKLNTNLNEFLSRNNLTNSNNTLEHNELNDLLHLSSKEYIDNTLSMLTVLDTYKPIQSTSNILPDNNNALETYRNTTKESINSTNSTNVNSNVNKDTEEIEELTSSRDRSEILNESDTLSNDKYIPLGSRLIRSKSLNDCEYSSEEEQENSRLFRTQSHRNLKESDDNLYILRDIFKTAGIISNQDTISNVNSLNRTTSISNLSELGDDEDSNQLLNHLTKLWLQKRDASPSHRLSSEDTLRYNDIFNNINSLTSNLNRNMLDLEELEVSKQQYNATEEKPELTHNPKEEPVPNTNLVPLSDIESEPIPNTEYESSSSTEPVLVPESELQPTTESELSLYKEPIALSIEDKPIPSIDYVLVPNTEYESISDTEYELLSIEYEPLPIEDTQMISNTTEQAILLEDSILKQTEEPERIDSIRPATILKDNDNSLIEEDNQTIIQPHNLTVNLAEKEGNAETFFKTMLVVSESCLQENIIDATTSNNPNTTQTLKNILNPLTQTTNTSEIYPSNQTTSLNTEPEQLEQLEQLEETKKQLEQLEETEEQGEHSIENTSTPGTSQTSNTSSAKSNLNVYLTRLSQDTLTKEMVDKELQDTNKLKNVKQPYNLDLSSLYFSTDNSGSNIVIDIRIAIIIRAINVLTHANLSLKNKKELVDQNTLNTFIFRNYIELRRAISRAETITIKGPMKWNISHKQVPQHLLLAEIFRLLESAEYKKKVCLSHMILEELPIDLTKEGCRYTHLEFNKVYYIGGLRDMITQPNFLSVIHQLMNNIKPILRILKKVSPETNVIRSKITILPNAMAYYLSTIRDASNDEEPEIEYSIPYQGISSNQSNTTRDLFVCLYEIWKNSNKNQHQKEIHTNPVKSIVPRPSSLPFTARYCKPTASSKNKISEKALSKAGSTTESKTKKKDVVSIKKPSVKTKCAPEKPTTTKQEPNKETSIPDNKEESNDSNTQQKVLDEYLESQLKQQQRRIDLGGGVISLEQASILAKYRVYYELFYSKENTNELKKKIKLQSSSERVIEILQRTILSSGSSTSLLPILQNQKTLKRLAIKSSILPLCNKEISSIVLDAPLECLVLYSELEYTYPLMHLLNYPKVYALYLGLSSCKDLEVLEHIKDDERIYKEKPDTFWFYYTYIKRSLFSESILIDSQTKIFTEEVPTLQNDLPSTSGTIPEESALGAGTSIEEETKGIEISSEQTELDNIQRKEEDKELKESLRSNNKPLKITCPRMYLLAGTGTVGIHVAKRTFGGSSALLDIFPAKDLVDIICNDKIKSEFRFSKDIRFYNRTLRSILSPKTLLSHIVLQLKDLGRINLHSQISSILEEYDTEHLLITPVNQMIQHIKKQVSLNNPNGPVDDSLNNPLINTLLEKMQVLPPGHQAIQEIQQIIDQIRISHRNKYNMQQKGFNKIQIITMSYLKYRSSTIMAKNILLDGISVMLSIKYSPTSFGHNKLPIFIEAAYLLKKTIEKYPSRERLLQMIQRNMYMMQSAVQDQKTNMNYGTIYNTILKDYPVDNAFVIDVFNYIYTTLNLKSANKDRPQLETRLANYINTIFPSRKIMAETIYNAISNDKYTAIEMLGISIQQLVIDNAPIVKATNSLTKLNTTYQAHANYIQNLMDIVIEDTIALKNKIEESEDKSKGQKDNNALPNNTKPAPTIINTLLALSHIASTNNPKIARLVSENNEEIREFKIFEELSIWESTLDDQLTEKINSLRKSIKAKADNYYELPNPITGMTNLINHTLSVIRAIYNPDPYLDPFLPSDNNDPSTKNSKTEIDDVIDDIDTLTSNSPPSNDPEGDISPENIQNIGPEWLEGLIARVDMQLEEYSPQAALFFDLVPLHLDLLPLPANRQLTYHKSALTVLQTIPDETIYLFNILHPLTMGLLHISSYNYNSINSVVRLSFDFCNISARMSDVKNKVLKDPIVTPYSIDLFDMDSNSEDWVSSYSRHSSSTTARDISTSSKTSQKTTRPSTTRTARSTTSTNNTANTRTSVTGTLKKTKSISGPIGFSRPSGSYSAKYSKGSRASCFSNALRSQATDITEQEDMNVIPDKYVVLNGHIERIYERLLGVLNWTYSNQHILSASNFVLGLIQYDNVIPLDYIHTVHLMTHDMNVITTTYLPTEPTLCTMKMHSYLGFSHITHLSNLLKYNKNKNPMPKGCAIELEGYGLNKIHSIYKKFMQQIKKKQLSTSNYYKEINKFHNLFNNQQDPRIIDISAMTEFTKDMHVTIALPENYFKNTRCHLEEIYMNLIYLLSMAGQGRVVLPNTTIAKAIQCKNCLTKIQRHMSIVDNTITKMADVNPISLALHLVSATNQAIFQSSPCDSAKDMAECPVNIFNKAIVNSCDTLNKTLVQFILSKKLDLKLKEKIEKTDQITLFNNSSYGHTLVYNESRVLGDYKTLSAFSLTCLKLILQNNKYYLPQLFTCPLGTHFLEPRISNREKEDKKVRIDASQTRSNGVDIITATLNAFTTTDRQEPSKQMNLSNPTFPWQEYSLEMNYRADYLLCTNATMYSFLMHLKNYPAQNIISNPFHPIYREYLLRLLCNTKTVYCPAVIEASTISHVANVCQNTLSSYVLFSTQAYQNLESIQNSTMPTSIQASTRASSASQKDKKGEGIKNIIKTNSTLVNSQVFLFVLPMLTKLDESTQLDNYITQLFSSGATGKLSTINAATIDFTMYLYKYLTQAFKEANLAFSSYLPINVSISRIDSDSPIPLERIFNDVPKVKLSFIDSPTAKHSQSTDSIYILFETSYITIIITFREITSFTTN